MGRTGGGGRGSKRSRVARACTWRGEGWFVALICAALLAAPAAAISGEPEKFSQGISRGHTSLRQPRAPARGADDGFALISIILDDLGEQYAAGLRAVDLPGAVACAFLPYTRFSAAQAERAHARGKEVLLHLPLQPGKAQPYPVGLTLASGRSEMAAYLESALASVPHARGVNNHQGSLLTEMPQHMDWLMSEIKLYPRLYFVDSRTSSVSVAYRVALARAVPAAERQFFLDTERGEAAVRAAFHQLVRYARRNERALAIGHPYPETFRVLEQELPRLAQYRVKLVAPSELIAAQSGQPIRNDRYYKQLKLSPTMNLAATNRNLIAGSAAAH